MEYRGVRDIENVNRGDGGRKVAYEYSFLAGFLQEVEIYIHIYIYRGGDCAVKGG